MEPCLTYAPESSGWPPIPDSSRADPRIGLITNPTGVLPDLTPGATALRAAGVPLTALFSPEHGMRGTAQAGSGEREGLGPVDRAAGLRHLRQGRPRAGRPRGVLRVDTLPRLRHLRHRHAFLHLRLDDARPSSRRPRGWGCASPLTRPAQPPRRDRRGGSSARPGVRQLRGPGGRPGAARPHRGRARPLRQPRDRRRPAGDHRGGLARHALRGHRPALGDALGEQPTGETALAIRAPACSRARTCRRGAAPPGRSS